MKLQLFRDHLSHELSRLPDIRCQEIQSYALTTAILARTLVQRLEIDDLRIDRADGSQGQTYSFVRILNNLIHYRAFSPVSKQSGDDSADCIVRLYSDETRKEGEFYWISLRAYFDLITKFAHDDIFVASHLLRRLITRLSQVTNVNDGFDADFLRDIADQIGDALELAIVLEESNSVTFPRNAYVDRYIDTSPRPLVDGGRWTPGPTVSSAEFIRGFNTVWRFSPFTPFKEKLGDVDGYCVLIEKLEPKADGGLDAFVIPFTEFLVVFKDLKSQCEAG